MARKAGYQHKTLKYKHLGDNMKIKETIIKALSLGTGLAIGLILIAKVCYEMSHDTCYADHEQIYQIRTVYTQHGEDRDFPHISGAIAP